MGLPGIGETIVTNSHPLDPLSADEIRQAAAIVRRDREIGDTWRFASIELKEPAKADLPALEGGRMPGGRRREAIVVCWNRADGQAYRAMVSLTGDEVTGWEHLPGQQPNMTVDEWHECDEMLRAHPALARGAGPARHHRHVPGAHRHVGLRRRARPRALRKAAGSAGATSGTGAASWATRTPTTSPACTRSST